MVSTLDNLTGPGRPLAEEPPDANELNGLIIAGIPRLKDAANESLALESRFDLAYNAAHSLCLSALRWHGYRAQHRYVVFQVLPTTLGLGPEVWRILDRAHNKRNLGEYEGFLDIDLRFVTDVIAAAQVVAESVQKLGPVED